MKEEDIKKLIDKLQYFDYDKLLNKIRKNVKKPSVLVTGGTGVGKSSLINHLFGMDVAKTGNGKPMTDRITRYEPENYDVVLYDTLGYEVGEDKQQQFYKDVIGFVKKANGQSDIKKHVHLAWYCISAANKRVTPTDLDAIAALDGLTEVCVVLTQIDAATMVELDEMKQVLQKKLPKTSVFLVSIDPRVPEEKMQWNELLGWSVDHLDAGLQLAFAQALGQELHVKHVQADKLIHRYVAAAAGAVVCPLPMTDSAALIAIQTTMATHLFNFWGIDRGTDNNTGRIFSRSLLKLIPGAGSIAATVVNSGVATSFTYAFGRAVNEVCYKTASRMANGEKVDITSAFAMDVIMKLIQKYYNKK